MHTLSHPHNVCTPQTGDFAAARDAARVLEEYRKIWEFGRAWDGDAYAAQPRGLAEVGVGCALAGLAALGTQTHVRPRS
jgi:hypothetical protein